MKDDYQTLFRGMLGGFSVHEIICDNLGKPVDYRFLNVDAFFLTPLEELPWQVGVRVESELGIGSCFYVSMPNVTSKMKENE